VRSKVEAQLASKLNPRLVKELLDAHSEVKRNFYLGGLRLSAVEGGRFCEAAFRILQDITESKHTPIGRTLPKTDDLIFRLSQLDSSRFSDAIRLHIPRSLRLVYDIRNKRDTAHLGDGIDPNLQDATLVVTVTDWVLAEFIRLYHNVLPDEASRIVDGIVKRAAPVVQDFNGFLKVLNPKVGVSDHCVILLYQSGELGASYADLENWVRPSMRGNLKRTLTGLVEQRYHAHFDGKKYYITRSGELYVEQNNLINPG
jgi:hypothetical protein